MGLDTYYNNMNVFKIYYDDAIKIRVLELDCNYNYTEESKVKIEGSISNKINNNVDDEFLQKQDGIIGHARVPTTEERERENRGITVTLDSKHLNE